MSVIACRVTGDGISIAADSRVTYGDVVVTRGQSLADQKLWLTPEGLLVAFCGDSALGSILRRWTREQIPDDSTEWAITAWVDAFQEWRRDRFPDAGEIENLSVMMVFRGRAWVIDQYSASEIPLDGYMAHGSGMGAAMGALYCGASAFDAVAAAATHQEGCGFPVVWATVTPDGEITGNVERMEARMAREVLSDA